MTQFSNDAGEGAVVARDAEGVSGVSHRVSELEGTWVVDEATAGGEEIPRVVGQRLTFEGDRFRIEKDGRLLFGGRFTVDATAEPPAIELDQSETETFQGLWLGIYRKVWNRLTISDNALDMSKPRPRDFAEACAGGYIMIDYTRVR